MINSWLVGRALRLRDHTVQREPDFCVGGRQNPYMMRWWVIPRNKFFNIYLHQILRSDDDKALHDHPWVNMSFLLEGGYVEHTIAEGGVHKRAQRIPGDLVVRMAHSAHRLEVKDGQPCWTLFLTGPVVRVWGFHCRKGWVPWKQYANVDADGKGNSTGQGCGEFE